jgi:hypothetical protein
MDLETTSFRGYNDMLYLSERYAPLGSLKRYQHEHDLFPSRSAYYEKRAPWPIFMLYRRVRMSKRNRRGRGELGTKYASIRHDVVRLSQRRLGAFSTRQGPRLAHGLVSSLPFSQTSPPLQHHQHHHHFILVRFVDGYRTA